MIKKISTILITYNAEATLEQCLKSVAPISDEIIVVDSLSTDATLSIAKQFTNRVYSQEWQGYSRQKEIAIEKTNNSWILWIDSDEVLSPQLAKAIESLSFEQDGYYLNRKSSYLGKWIHHCGWHPDYILRLFNRDKAKLSGDQIHEKVLVSGSTGQVSGILYHYSYRNMAHHLAKMNTFTTLVAQQMYARKKPVSPFFIIGRPLFHFTKVYFFKGGLLDGFTGLIVCLLSGHYVFLKYCKLFELYRTGGEAQWNTNLPLE